MASVVKFEHDVVLVELRHNHREIKNNSNQDIDPARSVSGNYSLTPYIDIPKTEYYQNREYIRKQEYKFYKNRKSELYCYGRKDVKTLCSWVITCPKEIIIQEEKDRFFRETSNFLIERYGIENTVSVTVHADEGRAVVKDGETQFVGRDHLHFCFIPAVKIDHEQISKKKKHIKAMDDFDEKISANDRINRTELRRFHPELQEYLSDKGIKCKIYDPDKSKSINLTVSQLKELSDRGIVVDKSITVDDLIDYVKTKDIEMERVREMECELDIEL